MVLAIVTVFAMAQDDNQVCVIFQRCHQKVSKTYCFAQPHGDLPLTTFIIHVFLTLNKLSVLFINLMILVVFIHFEKETV